jgi:hypothetical protein
MRKKLIFCVVFLLLSLPLLFSRGVNEKAYDSFWSIIENYYPLYYVARENGLDLESLKENGKTNFSEDSSEEEMLFLFRSICYKFVTLDYIDASIYSSDYTDVSEQTETSAGNTKTPRYQYIPTLKTVIFTIPSFDTVNLSEDFISSALAELDDVDNIIFDVTGNKTGNYNDDLTAVLAPFGGSWNYVYRAYYRNRYTAEKVFDSGDIKETESELYRETYKLPFYVEVSRSYDFGSGGLNEKLRSAKRWILVDETTSYTADFFASFAEATGWATVVGFNTKGNGTGLPFMNVFLEGKNYVLSFNSTVIDNTRGGLKSISGTIPNITADDGRSALKLCLDLIEDEMKKE